MMNILNEHAHGAGSATANRHGVGYAEELWQGPRSEYPYRSEEVDPWYVPPLYRVEGKGVLWYNGVVTGFLFKPIASLREIVDRTLHSLGLLDTPFIGVQVRSSTPRHRSACWPIASMVTVQNITAGEEGRCLRSDAAVPRPRSVRRVCAQNGAQVRHTHRLHRQ